MIPPSSRMTRPSGRMAPAMHKTAMETARIAPKPRKSARPTTRMRIANGNALCPKSINNALFADCSSESRGQSRIHWQRPPSNTGSARETARPALKWGRSGFVSAGGFASFAGSGHISTSGFTILTGSFGTSAGGFAVSTGSGGISKGGFVISAGGCAGSASSGSISTGGFAISASPFASGEVPAAFPPVPASAGATICLSL